METRLMKEYGAHLRVLAYPRQSRCRTGFPDSKRSGSLCLLLQQRLPASSPPKRGSSPYKTRRCAQEYFKRWVGVLGVVLVGVGVMTAGAAEVRKEVSLQSL